jgi:hypothetical protein
MLTINEIDELNPVVPLVLPKLVGVTAAGPPAPTVTE